MLKHEDYLYRVINFNLVSEQTFSYLKRDMKGKIFGLEMKEF